MAQSPTSNRSPKTFLSLPHELRQQILILSVETIELDKPKAPHLDKSWMRYLEWYNTRVCSRFCYRYSYRSHGPRFVNNLHQSFQYYVDDKFQKALKAMRSAHSWTITLRLVHRDIWEDVEYMAQGRISRRALKKRLVEEDKAWRAENPDLWSLY